MMTNQPPPRQDGDGLPPLDVRIQTERYAMFCLLRANAPHERLREQWSKLETLLDTPSRDSADGAGDFKSCGDSDVEGKSTQGTEFTAPPKGEPDAMRDLVTHREAWRSAIEIAIEQADDSRDSMDEKGYWQHELKAFDRTFAALPSPDALGQGAERGRSSDGTGELVAALRRLAIKQHIRLVSGGGNVPSGGSCALCKAEWAEPLKDNEWHQSSCVLFLSPSGAVAAEPVASEHSVECRLCGETLHDDERVRVCKALSPHPGCSYGASPPVRGDREIPRPDRAKTAIAFAKIIYGNRGDTDEIFWSHMEDEGKRIAFALYDAAVKLEWPSNLPVQPGAGERDDGESKALEAVLDVIDAAYHALDNSEQTTREVTKVGEIPEPGCFLFEPWYSVCTKLEALDDLPDDQPGYIMTGNAKAAWALRRLRQISRQPQHSSSEGGR